jgi:hypothetical protein
MKILILLLSLSFLATYSQEYRSTGQVILVHKDNRVERVYESQRFCYHSWGLLHANDTNYKFDSIEAARKLRFAEGKALIRKKEAWLISIHTDTVHANFIKFDLTRVFLLELFGTYERRLTHAISLETGLGWQFSDGGTWKINLGVSTWMVFPFQGILFTIGPKFYDLSPKKHYYYFQPVFLYRYSWFNGKWADALNESADRYYENQYRNIYGASINIGWMKNFSGLIVDLSWGLGVKYAVIEQKVFAIKYYENSNIIHFYDPPVTFYAHKWNPVINLSLKMGFGF